VSVQTPLPCGTIAMDASYLPRFALYLLSRIIMVEERYLPMASDSGYPAFVAVHSPPVPPGRAVAEDVAHGKALVEAGDCASCHTAIQQAVCRRQAHEPPSARSICPT